MHFSEFLGAKLTIKTDGKVVFEYTMDFSPELSFNEVIMDEINPDDCYISLETKDGVVLVDWQTEPEVLKPIPDPAKAAKDPEEIASVEQLYLRGLHLEQYRHATYDPTKYYLEALKREPGDVRNNNAGKYVGK